MTAGGFGRPGTMSPMAPPLPRPRQVTLAGWAIMAASVAVVVTVFDQIAGLRSLETREAVADAISGPPFDGFGLSVEDVLSTVRVLAMVAAACATATAILGWQALQRSRSARLALSILAVPLFVTGLGAGGILSTVVAVAVATLWFQPSRDWFDGRWKPEPEPAHRPTRPETTSRTSARASGQVPGQVSGPPAPGPEDGAPQQPPPYAGWGTSGVAGPAQQPAQQPVQQPVAGWTPPQAGWTPVVPGVADARQSRGRPPAVLAAAVLTWVCSLLLGGLFVAGAAWLIADPATLMDEVRKQNPELVADGTVTEGVVRGMLIAMAAGVAVWVLAACVLAGLLLRQRRWARTLLLVSTGAAALGLLAATLVNVGMVVPLAAAAAVFALLLRDDVVRWFDARG